MTAWSPGAYPEGAGARRRGPFRGDVIGPETSLHWWAHTRNQRSVALDVDVPDDVARLRRLVRTADVLVESAPPGDLARRGLGYDAPTLGRDNLRVLQDILGYDQERITALAAAGLLD